MHYAVVAQWQEFTFAHSNAGIVKHTVSITCSVDGPYMSSILSAFDDTIKAVLSNIVMGISNLLTLTILIG